ncbi:cell division protein ZapA [Bilifractor sp. HCP3S3_D3]|uniref:cell division protein ZapA n=1 Tax=unclassified Bilifractor TaxID=2815795 RepID=UPI003F89A589|nr:cell division protein ZapA [Eubacterium sp.]
MAEKHSVKVLIDGKAITLSGYESEEYLQRVAFYLNNKIAELSSISGYGRLTQDTKSMLLEFNIADDYFKAKSQVDSMEQDLENKDQSTYDIKHDLVAAQMEIERLKKENARLRESRSNDSTRK